MSEYQRDDSGRFSEKASEQAILKLFDASDDPFLTAPEIAAELDVTRQTATRWLKRMSEKGLVGRKEAGSNAVVWWAEYAPRLSPEAIAGVEESDRQRDRGEVVSLGEAKRRLGLDG